MFSMVKANVLIDKCLIRLCIQTYVFSNNYSNICSGSQLIFVVKCPLGSTLI